MSARSRTKGNVAESQLARWLRDHGHPDARSTRDARGGAQGGADIIGVDRWSIEVKNCARLDVPAWWRQTLAECPVGRLPALVIKPAGIADPGRWVVLRDARVPLPVVDARGDAKAAAVIAARSVIDENLWWRPTWADPLIVTTVADLWGMS